MRISEGWENSSSVFAPSPLPLSRVGRGEPKSIESWPNGSGQDLLNDVAVNIGQAEVAAAIAIR